MKNLLLLAAILCSLGAFIYFYEIRGEEKRQEVRQLEKSLLQLKQDEITSVKIATFQKESILLKKEVSGWMIERPIRSPADDGTVNVLLRDLESASRNRVFSDVDLSAQKYGLDNPRLNLFIEAGQASKSMLIGRDDFTGNNMYVQLEGDSNVFLTSRSLSTAVDKTLFQWRDKTVLNLERSQVRVIELNNDRGRIRFEHQNNEWFVKDPLRERADQNRVTGLLSAIEFAEAQEFVDDSPVQLEPYGLMPARTTLRIQFNDSKNWVILELGQKLGEYVLARNSVWPFIFTVKEELSDRLNQTVWDFRDKSLVDVEQSELGEVRFWRDDGEITMRYQDYAWIVELPKAYEGKEVQAYKFWYPITDIAFKTIDDKKSYDPSFLRPDVQMVVTSREGVERKFLFTQIGDQYLARRTDSGRQGTISEIDFKKLLFELEDVLADAP
ncbi:MAG: DUF4340 domain-containing protein [Acidobacteriota bacterium]|nr:DUF4340 domain-containing protein [Acidobacteriota bacterium]